MNARHPVIACEIKVDGRATLKGLKGFSFQAGPGIQLIELFRCVVHAWGAVFQRQDVRGAIRGTECLAE